MGTGQHSALSLDDADRALARRSAPGFRSSPNLSVTAAPLSDSSIPPPPGSPLTDRDSPVPGEDRYARDKAVAAYREAKAARAAAERTEVGLADVRRVLGGAPDPTQGIEGSGVLRSIALIQQSIVAVRTDIKDDRDERKRAEEVLERQRAGRLGLAKGIGWTIGVIATLLALVKGLYELFKR